MIRLLKKETYQARDYHSLYWVTSVHKTYKDDQRHHIITVHIDSGVAVKTDGCRLHVACLEGDYEDGDYEIIKRTKSEIVLIPADKGDWPDWERIISDCPVPYNGTDFPLDVSFDHNRPGMSLTLFFRDLYSNDVENAPGIDAGFIETAAEGFDYALVWYTDTDCPLFMVDSDMNRVAALMPFRV